MMNQIEFDRDLKIVNLLNYYAETFNRTGLDDLALVWQKIAKNFTHRKYVK